MDSNTFRKFLIINQVVIEKSSITCATCNNWLAPPICITNTANYCGQCSKDNELRYAALEDILRNYKYPCVNDNCEHLLDYAQIIEHANNCNNAVNCTFCKANCDKSKIWEHLRDEHQAEVIDTDKPKFALTINMPITKAMYLIEMQNAPFLFFCTQESEVLRGTLMKLRHLNSIDKYAIHMTTNKGNTSTHDGTLQQFAAGHSPANEIAMYFGIGDSCKLDVSLGARQHNDVPECPICMQAISSKLRQCVNGHNVCEDCGGKISSCPICRMKIVDHIFNVQHLYPDAIWPCKNYQSGCMTYLNGTQIEQHAKVCSFRSVKCCACPLAIRKCDFIEHLKSEHVLKNNFDVVETSFSAANKKTSSFTAYFQFDSEVFKCCSTSSDDAHLELKCELAYMNAKRNQYRFAFHLIRDKDSTQADYVLNDGISLNPCRISWERLHRPMYLRCCLFKNTSSEDLTSPSMNIIDERIEPNTLKTVMFRASPTAMRLPRVFFDVSCNEQPLGRIVMQLRSDVVPKTAKNFRALCTHEKGYGYKGSHFHQIWLNCAGGRIANHNDKECGDRFAPENELLEHAGPGTLAMFNTSVSCSEFFIFTAEKAPNWLTKDIKHVNFGRVVDGLDVVNKMKSFGAMEICIANCGQL